MFSITPSRSLKPGARSYCHANMHIVDDTFSDTVNQVTVHDSRRKVHLLLIRGGNQGNPSVAGQYMLQAEVILKGHMSQRRLLTDLYRGQSNNQCNENNDYI